VVNVPNVVTVNLAMNPQKEQS